MTQNPTEARATGAGAAWASFAVGLLYTAVSVYWGLGGSWLLDTVGASLTQAGALRERGSWCWRCGARSG